MVNVWISPKMKKIIIHLGLPKTATTTLQHHLFQKLHDEKKINFLGKVIEFDESGKAIWKNKIGSVIRDVCEGKVDPKDAGNIDELFHSDLINVFSDEGIVINYPFKKGLTISNKIENLKAFLCMYDVEILFSLRNPAEYFHSLYIQFYSEYYSSRKKFNSFDKFLNIYLKNENLYLSEMFDIPNIMSHLSSHFKTKVIVYEDLIFDSESYFQDLSILLDLSVTEIRICLDGMHENKKIENKKGKVTRRKIKISSLIPKRIFLSNKYLYRLCRFIYNFFQFKKIVSSNVLIVSKTHKSMDKIQRTKLNDKILFRNEFPYEKYNLNKEKLDKYGYFISE